MPEKQDLINHRLTATACKNYTDKEIKASEERILSIVARNNVDFIDHINEPTYRFTAPANAKLLMLQSIGGNTVKYNPSVASDSTKAMVKTMPSTVYDFDGSKFYGDSEVSENLLNITDLSERTISGVTYSKSNQKLYVNGTPTAQANYIFQEFMLPNGTYTYSYYSNKTSPTTVYLRVVGNTTTYIANGQSFTVDDTITTLKVQMYIGTSTTFDNLEYKFMIVKGSTAPATYKPYFSGIHNLELTGIRSEGANLFDKTKSVVGAIAVSNGVLISGATTYNASDYIEINSNKGTLYLTNLLYSSSNYGCAFYDANKTFISSSGSMTAVSFNIPSNAKYFRFSWQLSLISSDIIMLSYVNNISYQPYVTPTTKTIDLTQIKDNNNNIVFTKGLCGIDDVKDILTPYKAIGKLKYYKATGNETISSAGNPFLLYYDIPNVETKAFGKIICNKLETQSYNGIFNGEKYGCALFNGGSRTYIAIRVEGITQSISAYTQWITDNKPEFVFEMNTPIEVSIDLSATLRNIQGYSNGSIIAENTYNMDVESVITYNSIIQETLCPSITITRNGVEVETRNLPTITSDGYGVNADAHNLRVFSDYEGNAVNKRYTNVNKNSNLGSLNYTYNADNYQIFASETETQQQLGFKAQTQTLSKLYTYATTFSSFTTTDKCIYLSTDGNLYARDSYYNDATIFKTSLANESLYYELADTSKTETDMDDFDYFFDVEEGDVITFNNPYAQQVYATYSFLIKEAKSNE